MEKFVILLFTKQKSKKNGLNVLNSITKQVKIISKNNNSILISLLFLLY